MALDNVKIIGGHGQRNPLDYYPTPPEVTRAPMDYLAGRELIMKNDVVWEPACGDGAMVRAIRDAGYKCVGSDVDPKGSFPKEDFLEYQHVGFFSRFGVYGFDWIITNPPFSLSTEFIRSAYATGRPFAFLLKSQYWHSARRLPLFREVRPTDVLPLTWRPNFTGARSGSLMDMLWVVWSERRPRFTIYEPLDKPMEG